MISVTDSAIRHLRDLLVEKGASAEDDRGLRLFIQRGGCAGMQYGMKIASPQSGDTVVERGGVRLYVAAESAPFLQGAEVDYVDGLNDAGFRIQNPNAARSCGCGTSFEPAADPALARAADSEAIPPVPPEDACQGANEDTVEGNNSP